MKLLWILGVLFALALVRSSAWAAELKPGDTMPMGEVRMMNIDDRMMSLGDAAGEKGTLVIFACNHCPFVKAWQTRIAEIGNDGMKRGIGVILINSNDSTEFPLDDRAHMKEQAREGGFGFPYVVDDTSSIARAFGATRTPEAFLFDAKGLLVYHGAIDDNSNEPDKVTKHYLRDAVDALLAGKAAPVPETRSVGCSIKFRGTT